MTTNKPFYREKEISGHVGSVFTLQATDTHIYSGSVDQFVARWKINEGIQDNFTIKLDQPVYALCLAGSNLYIGLANGDLHLVDVNDRTELKYYTQHKKGIFEISFNSFTNHVYSVDADGNLCVWNNQTLDLEIYLPLDCGKVRNISVASDGKSFALGGQDGYCRVFNANNFNEESKWLAHKEGVSAILMDGDRIITGGKDALMKEWDRDGKELSKPIPAHNYVIYKIVRLNSEFIISASRDKTIKVWDNELNFIQRLDFKEAGHRHSVNDIAVIDNIRFVSCGDDGKIIIWRQG